MFFQFAVIYSHNSIYNNGSINKSKLLFKKIIIYINYIIKIQN